MTCIVAYKEADKIYMGGDDIAAYPATYDKHSYKHPKVFSKELNNIITIDYPKKVSRNILFGYTTSFRMGQILEYQFDVPKFDPRNINNNMEYMVKTFIPALYDLFDEHLYIKKSDADKATGGNFIVGFDNSIFTISSDFSIMEFEEPFACVGCGESYALGALYVASLSNSMNGEGIVKTAIEAAAKFSGFVGEKTTIIST